MQFTTGIALSLLATYAAAETFNKFPKDDLTCETKTGSETVPLDEIKATVRDGKEETPYESSAANIATSSQCSSQKLPFFYVRLALIARNYFVTGFSVW